MADAPSPLGATALEKLAPVLIVAVFVASITLLVTFGKDPSVIVGFASGPLVAGLAGLVLKKRTDKIESHVKVVEKQTNGMLQGPLGQILAGQATAATTAAAAHGESVEAVAAIAKNRVAVAEIVAHEVNDRLDSESPKG